MPLAANPGLYSSTVGHASNGALALSAPPMTQILPFTTLVAGALLGVGIMSALVVQVSVAGSYSSTVVDIVYLSV